MNQAEIDAARITWGCAFLSSEIRRPAECYLRRSKENKIKYRNLLTRRHHVQG